MRRLLIFSFSLLLCTNVQAQKPSNLLQHHLDAALLEKGLSQKETDKWQITASHTSSISNVTHTYIIQHHNGIQIHNAVGSIHTSENGKLVYLNESFLPNVTDRIQGDISNVMDPQQIISQVATQLGYVITEDISLQENIGGPSQKAIYTGGGISQTEIPIELMYLEKNENEIGLAYDLSIHSTQEVAWWSIKADAYTGVILDKITWMHSCDFGNGASYKENHSCSHESHANKMAKPIKKDENTAASVLTGNYNVYPYPVESPNHGGRTFVADPDDPIASPFGWHDDDGVTGAEYTITRGNNVHAYEDGDNPNYSPDGGAGLVFDYPINTVYSAGDQSEDAAITNLFYWNNIIHDMWFQYGFDEASGNFQELNYSGNGIGSDYVNAEAQDGSGTCNANMGTPPDGGNPTMQMYVCNSRDGDLDNAVIVHEYGHGISIRLTGGAGNSGCLNNQEQMGEGWSDWFGMMMTIEPGDAGTDKRGMGTWLFGQPADGDGIRPDPYSTDMAINDQTYDDIKVESVPHGVGSVWCTMLWEMAWKLIDFHGFDPDFYTGTGGNNIAMALVTEALKLQPCSPGFVDGRDAILAADAALYGGANTCMIWEAFAVRGLGENAFQGSSGSRSDGIEDFSVPSSCYPEISFDKTAILNLEGSGIEQPPLPGGCTPYSDFIIGVTLSKDPVGAADVSITPNAGTAELNYDFELITTALTFTVAGTQYVTYRIFNDQGKEIDEMFQLQLAITNQGSTDAVLGNDFAEFSIEDNEALPGEYYKNVLAFGDFETGNDGFLTNNPGSGDTWTRGSVADASSTNWTVPLNGSDTLFYANDDNCDCDMNEVNLETPIVSLMGLDSATIEFDLFFEGRTFQSNTETAELLISIDGGSTYNLIQTFSGVSGIWRNEVIDLSAHIGNNNVQLMIRYSDAMGWLYGIAIDNVSIKGFILNQPNIATVVSSSVAQEVSPNSDVTFYNAAGELMARIENGSTDLGCMTVDIDRQGSSATVFWQDRVREYATDKTYLFTPTNNGPTVDYDVTLYFTEPEKLGYEATTMKSWDVDTKMIKHPTTIAEITPFNPEPNGLGTVEQVVPTKGTNAWDPATYFSTASFSTGFSGMTMGDPGSVPSATVLGTMMLSGPFDSSTELMNDDLRTQMLIPLTEPYTALGYNHKAAGGDETILPSVLTVNTDDAIVDWVVMELRDKNDASIIGSTRSALLQRDGDIVDLDGISPVQFYVGTDNYYVSVTHRNHLGIMGQSTSFLSGGPSAIVDYANASTVLFGTDATEIIGNKQVMWSGDVDMNGIVEYTGNDVFEIFIETILHPSNATFNPNFTFSEYSTSDIDMNGVIEYTGNDVFKIFLTTLSHPANIMSNPNFTFTQQTP